MNLDDSQTRLLRRNKSRNKVSVGEPAEGSLKDSKKKLINFKHPNKRVLLSEKVRNAYMAKVLKTRKKYENVMLLKSVVM